MSFNIRSSLSVKFYQYVFSVIILGLLLGPLSSFFTKNQTEFNTVVAYSPNHKVTLKEVLTIDPSFIQVLNEIEGDKKVLEPALNAYFDRLLYRDFFSRYNFELSDELSWNLVLRQLSPQLTKENQEQLEYYIQKNFSSKKNFLNVVKNQMLTSYLKRSLLELSSTPAPQTKLDRAHEQIIRHVDIYTFDIDQARKNVSLPQQQQLNDYFAEHQDDYQTEPMIKAEFLTLRQHQYQASPELKEVYAQELEQNGYSEINEKLIEEYAAFKAFERLEEKATTFDDPEDLLAFIKEVGFDLDEQFTQTESLTEDELDTIVGHKGIFNIGHRLDPNGENSWTVIPTDGACVFIKFVETTPARQLSFTEASPQVLQDWINQQAYSDAKEQATVLKEAVIAKGEPAVRHYQQVKHIELQNFFTADQASNEVPNHIKIAIGKLFDPRIDPNQCFSIHVDRANQQVQLVFMKSIDIEPLSALPSMPSDTNAHFSQYVQELFYDKAFENQIKHDFGYTVSSDFWQFFDKKSRS